MNVKTFPLYEIPEKLEEAAILDGSILEKYSSSLEPFNEKAKEVLSKFKVINGELANSSPLMLVRLQNSGALPERTRLATRKDLEKAISIRGNEEFLRGNYVDFGFALRTAGDSYSPNDQLAKSLAEQLKKRGIALNEGVLIPISVLRDKDDASSFYGVTLDLNDGATRETVRDLREFRWNYSRNEGLVCAGFGGGRCWSSYDEHLGYSLDYGRVVVVRSAQGVSKKISGNEFNDYQREVAQKRQQYISDLTNLREQIDAELRSAQ
mgnify:CR=1 FL=1